MVKIQICKCPSHGKKVIFRYVYLMVDGILTCPSRSKNPGQVFKLPWDYDLDIDKFKILP
jgi:hypothetical protein